MKKRKQKVKQRVDSSVAGTMPPLLYKRCHRLLPVFDPLIPVTPQEMKKLVRAPSSAYVALSHWLSLMALR